jgi:hypothetical protein
MKRLVIVTLLACAACGKLPPTSPLAACPPSEEHFVRSDTSYFSGTQIPAVVTDVYACSVEVK